MTVDYLVDVELDQVTTGSELSRQQAFKDWLALTALHALESEIVESGLEILEFVDRDDLPETLQKLTSEVLSRTVVSVGHKGEIQDQHEEESGPLSSKGQKYIEHLFGPVDELELTLEDTAYLAHLIVDLHSSTLRTKNQHKVDHKFVLQKSLEGYKAKDIIDMLPEDVSVSAISLILSRISKQLAKEYSVEGRKMILASELEFYRRNPQGFKDEVAQTKFWPSNRVTRSRGKDTEDEEFTSDDWAPRQSYADENTLSFLIDESEELMWQENALCAQTDPEAFFPEKGGSTREAKRICLTCDVRGECLEYAVNHDERFGIWGGLSERERRKLKKRP